MSTTNDPARMLAWLAFGLALYAASFLATADLPTVQTICYKLGHVTTLAWFGYWISRNALGRIKTDSSPTDRLARAVVIAGVVVAGSLGL